MLFAAARGARIHGWDASWVSPTDSISKMMEAPDHYIVNPDDAHLQYGSISKALIYMVVSGEYCAAYVEAWEYCKIRFPEVLGTAKLPRESRLLRLILAEFLADEGL
jgi:hypothetical protein